MRGRLGRAPPAMESLEKAAFSGHHRQVTAKQMDGRAKVTPQKRTDRWEIHEGLIKRKEKTKQQMSGSRQQ